MGFFWQMKDLSKTSFLLKYWFSRLNRGNEKWGWNPEVFFKMKILNEYCVVVRTAKNERKVGYETWLTNGIVIIAIHITKWATFAYNILYCEDFLNSLTITHKIKHIPYRCPPESWRLWKGCYMWVTYLLNYVYTYLLTYLLTPWSRVLLENLIGSQLVKKFPTFHGTRRFITAFRSTIHGTYIFWVNMY
jgi:hypothetical protein